MIPTETLKNEHIKIREMLKVLDKISSTDKMDVTRLEEAIEFVVEFADKRHHGKEEDLLFPEMEKAGMSKESGPIAVMLYEHNLGRSLVKAIKEGVAEYKKGNQSAKLAISDNIKKFSQLLDTHIEKENMILFPMADRIVSKDVMAELEKRFEKVDIDFNVAHKTEYYLESLKSLKGIYN